MCVCVVSYRTEFDLEYTYDDYSNYDTTTLEKSMPVQNVYFFKKGNPLPISLSVIVLRTKLQLHAL